MSASELTPLQQVAAGVMSRLERDHGLHDLECSWCGRAVAIPGEGRDYLADLAKLVDLIEHAAHDHGTPVNLVSILPVVAYRTEELHADVAAVIEAADLQGDGPR